MNKEDQKAIEELFGRLESVEARSGPRDAEAEAFIRRSIAAHPGAPYYMAQTIIVQNQALEAAGRRIEELERSGGEKDGGLLSGLFGSGRTRSAVPASGRRTAPRTDEARGGGFLAGAAQTAMGVAGGVVLGNLITGALFGGSAAEASEANNDAPDDAADSDGDFGDAGGDFGDF